MTDKKFPSPEEIQKEFEEFVQKRFGSNVQVISQTMPFRSHEPKAHAETQQSGEEKKSFDLTFDLKPKDVKNYLDRFVIGQSDAKKALAIAVCDHYNQVISHHRQPDLAEHDNYAKQNVLIIGPTGVGKTYMVKQIAKLIGVPFVKADATRFSETGYMGANVEDLVKDLVQQANGDISKAQYGIVYLDEADKLATRSKHIGRDVSGRGVQLGLLKLMEETEVDLRSGNDPASQMQAFLDIQQKGKIEKQIINTKHILFIVSGAFTGLEEIIAKRRDDKRIGFGQVEDKRTLQNDQLLKHASTEDFIEYGFEPEFIGRMPVRVACEHLDANMLYSILTESEGSIIKQYISSFRSYGIDVKFDQKALRAIANLAANEKTGARALMTVCERTLRDYKYELPSTDLLELVVTEEIIYNPKETLSDLIKECGPDSRMERKAIREFENQFARKHKMQISFDKEAIKLIAERSRREGVPASSICEHVLQSYEHGLKLIQQNTGQQEFILTKDCVENPKLALEKMIRDSYQIFSRGDRINEAQK